MAGSSKHLPLILIFLALLGGAYVFYQPQTTPEENFEATAEAEESSTANMLGGSEAPLNFQTDVVDEQADPRLLIAELNSARSALATAQKLADERNKELESLRSSYDSLHSELTQAKTSIDSCETEVSAAKRAASAASAMAQTAIVPAAAVSGNSQQDFDIDSYRAERLAAVQPHIIECADAGEGESQEACHLPRKKRYRSIGQKGATIWMTGLSGSGKSTIARALEDKLVVELGLHVQNLDGDNVRTGLNRDLGFSPGDRAESVRRVGEMSVLFSGGGVITLVTLVSPYRSDRDAVRARHEAEGLPFVEVLLDVPLTVVQERDPKGLYAKAASGELKGMTGMSDDAPYEAPQHPEVRLPTHEMGIDQSVAQLMKKLKELGILEGGPTHPQGLPLPYGTRKLGDFLEDELIAQTPEKKSALLSEAATLPKARVSDIEINWLQVIGEGWAAPLRGFLREGPLTQVLHFNSLVTDTFNRTGAVSVNERFTNWNDYTTRGVDRQSLSVPITLPATDYTKAMIEKSGKKAVSLVDKDGRVLAVLRNPEIYEHRKEEIVTRCFGAIDPGHPYIQHIYSSGNWLIGGEVELVERIRYNDGLDRWRLTPKELFREFERRNADVVYAFQTRNPTHAGHAYLMKTGLEKMREKGFERPVLWLSPLGGWTKEDDVPLDVRVKQHQAIIDEGMLDERTTVMAIWPSPMIYAGPTEVQFHAASRRNAGASYFVVGRDAAGMKGSMEAEAHQDDDLYKGEHARYVLQMSPVLEDGAMGLISFDKFYYDKRDHQMKDMDPARPDDFISISGSKMRALARQGATPCSNDIPSDLLAANCVPPGFMSPAGWAIVVDYYQNLDNPAASFIPFSKPLVDVSNTQSTFQQGQYGSLNYRLFFQEGGSTVSPWHDIPLQSAAAESGGALNFITEIPMYTSAKMEVSKSLPNNPIAQDEKKGMPRYYQYGSPFFNYGLFPQTWEDPSVCHNDICGDDDPLDVIELGDSPLPMGSVTPVKVLGTLELIDEGETDYKILVIRTSDPLASSVSNMDEFEMHKPGTVTMLRDWLIKYKTAEGKGLNTLASDEPYTVQKSMEIISDCNDRWSKLVSGQTTNSKGHYITTKGSTAVSSLTSTQQQVSQPFIPPSTQVDGSDSDQYFHGCIAKVYPS